MNVLIFGGKGALGSKIVEVFGSKRWATISVDHVVNKFANKNITPPKTSFINQANFIKKEVELAMNGTKFDAVLCVSGGWCGGKVSSDKVFEQLELMHQQTVQPSIIAAHIAHKFMKPNGFLLLTGAAAALEATPGMIAYGIAKNSVHHLTVSLGKDSDFKEATVVGVLPTTLDTEQNRLSMPDADFTSWTPLLDISTRIFEWSSDAQKRPKSGSLVKIETQKGVTQSIVINNL